ncbi:tectonic-2 isoform X2 [Hemiscyllium ocellatum]|uniref:tectonic-2 isoform X2 n=1 Tax=Hemiscyllium ocellatum TaxID=170820 RepID=UPI002965D922|nr:tectonic-2 isoform X2 [Hemiscyllium ocellatum]
MAAGLLAILSRLLCCGVLLSLDPSHGLAGLVFQPSFLIASGPEVNVYLVGESSTSADVGVETVTHLNDSSQSNCVKATTTDQWSLTTSKDEMNVNVQLTLNRSLVPCEDLLNETSCCAEPLCIVETLRVTACLDGKLAATLLVQVMIFVNSTFHGIVNESKVLIPKQKYHPLGPCPCNLTAYACDVRCCCDEECTPSMIQLFHSYCFPGVFGGNVSQPFDHLCSVQNANAPDWFPFLCLESSFDNSPYLGLFYDGDTVSVSHDVSFGTATSAVLNVPVGYHQGDHIVKNEDEYLTIPQRSLNGQCLTNAPVAYLEDFDARCVTPLTAAACMDNHDISDDIRIQNGQGLLILANITYQKTTDLSKFIATTSVNLGPSPANQPWFPEHQNITASVEPIHKSETKLVDGICENMILQADYVFRWEGNVIINVTLLVTLGNVSLDSPGYQIGKPVLGTFGNGSTLQKAPVSIWQPVGNGLCSSAQITSVLFGKNSLSGCLLRLGIDAFDNCTGLRSIIYKKLLTLMPTNISRRGNSNPSDLSEWVPLFKVLPNDSANFESELSSFCTGIPANLNLWFFTSVVGAIEGVPQHEILGAEANFSTVTWQVNCGGGDAVVCEDSSLLQSFSVSFSVQFIEIPVQPEPMKTSFQMNYFEYDCSRNDICWPELAYPLTRRYQGETYCRSIAYGMLLVFFFLVTALLGDPWNKIRKAWQNAMFH